MAESPTTVRSRIRALRPELSEAMNRVADLLLDRPEVLATASIGDLAAATGTSPATVTRFSRAVGCAGYGELRIRLATELARHEGAGWQVDVGREISPTDPLPHVLSVIRAMDTATINDTVEQLDLVAVERAVTALATARRTDLFGAGGSGILAAELQQRLHRIDRPSWAWTDPHAALTSAALLRPGDVAFALSHSGRTREPIDVLTEARRRGATTIALTNFPRSPITAVADIVLTTVVRETTFRPEAIAARHSALVVIDCVYIGVAQRTYPTAEPALTRTSEAVAEHRYHTG